ncbi:MAG: SpoIIE family protein phosphatase [Symploca sp. SIO2E9]|nr:SpoIIE family protein phosphatase [Symploca sp. SIO2E9]
MSQADKLKLMVVDDEPDNLELLNRTFRRDFRVFTANGAMKALEILNTEGEMAVIISDQRMPQMNGTEFLSLTVDRFPETIRILLTGFADVDDLVEAINSGQVFKYITKPWNPDHLKAVVQQAADTYRVVKQRTRQLRRTLRREKLLNLMTTAIRESLDYGSMLKTLVKTIGEHCDTSSCMLRPVEDNQPTPECFFYQTESKVENPTLLETESLVQEVIESRQKQLVKSEIESINSTHLIIPLICQQELLAVMSLYQQGRERNWSAEDIELIEAVAEQAALAISQAKLYQRIQLQTQKIRQELDVARQIQKNLLRQSWGEVEGVRVQAHCYPAQEVGGDFFEVYVHPQGDIWLAVGDVSGKGVPAALFMASAISLLRRELSQEISPEPQVVMQNLNSTMLENLVSTNCLITMVLVRYTPQSRQLVYANAGHIYPLVWSHRLLVTQQDSPGQSLTAEPTYLEVRGVPLGILPNWQARAGALTLNVGEVLLLTSDGITEATLAPEMSNTYNSNQSSKNMLYQAGLWQLLLEEKAPLDLTHLLARFRECTNPQEDDQTILSLEVI